MSEEVFALSLRGCSQSPILSASVLENAPYRLFSATSKLDHPTKAYRLHGALHSIALHSVAVQSIAAVTVHVRSLESGGEAAGCGGSALRLWLHASWREIGWQEVCQLHDFHQLDICL